MEFASCVTSFYVHVCIIICKFTIECKTRLFACILTVPVDLSHEYVCIM